MNERNQDALKAWSAPVLEELTVDLGAIAGKKTVLVDGKSANSKS